MYIIAIAWIYVVLLMAFTEASIVAGLATFLFYGLVPLSILLYLLGTPQRRRNRKKRELQQSAQQAALSRDDAAAQEDAPAREDAAAGPPGAPRT